MSLDVPASGSVPSSFTVAGWAIDQAAASGTGVSAVHVWAFPSSGTGKFLGGANYGGNCPDVGAAFGSRFSPSGFHFSASLPSGSYTIAAYALSTVTNTFNQSRFVKVTIP